MPDCVENRHHRGHAQGTFAALQQISDRFDGVEVRFLPLAVDNPRQRILQDPRPAFSRSTFSAAVLLLDPRHILRGHGDNVGSAIKDNDPVPTKESANLPLLKISIAQL